MINEATCNMHALSLNELCLSDNDDDDDDNDDGSTITILCNDIL